MHSLFKHKKNIFVSVHQTNIVLIRSIALIPRNPLPLNIMHPRLAWSHTIIYNTRTIHCCATVPVECFWFEMGPHHTLYGLSVNDFVWSVQPLPSRASSTLKAVISQVAGVVTIKMNSTAAPKQEWLPIARGSHWSSLPFRLIRPWWPQATRFPSHFHV